MQQQAHCCNRRKNKNLNIYIEQQKQILKTFLDDDQIRYCIKIRNAYIGTRMFP